MDILPTLCEITGTNLPGGRRIDGISLVPLMEEKPLKRKNPLFWYYSPSRPVCVIREGDWSLIADPEMDIPRDNLFNEDWIGMIKDSGLANFRLYNLKEDIGQINDVSADNPIRLNKMKKRMNKIHQQVIQEALDWRTFNWP